MVRRSQGALFALVVSLLLGCAPAYALIYKNGYVASRDYRFYVGADRNFLAEGFDLSGVATDFDEVDGRATGGPCATMISPSYFVTSAHYGVGPGTPLVFHENNNPLPQFLAFTGRRLFFATRRRI